MTVSSANGAKALVVLVVEDEFFVRDDIATFLRDPGYVVVEGASGEEAIALCCKSAAMIDVVLTDINLGGSTSGWDVAECFRIERPDIPVLYISGDRIDFERCVPGSMFVAKPLNHEDILSACRRLA